MDGVGAGFSNFRPTKLEFKITISGEFAAVGEIDWRLKHMS